MARLAWSGFAPSRDNRNEAARQLAQPVARDQRPDRHYHLLLLTEALVHLRSFIGRTSPA